MTPATRAPKPLPAFAEGAVQAVSGTVASRIVDLIREYPVAETHRRFVRNLGGEFVYAAPLRERGHQGKWLCLVRFGDVIERRFGLVAEIPLIYDSHNDLQLRTVDGIQGFLKELPETETTSWTSLWISVAIMM